MENIKYVDLMMAMIFAIMIAATAYIMFSLLVRRGKEPKKGKEEFYKYLDRQFELDLIKDKNDFEIIKNIVERDFGEIYSLAPLLEDYIKHLLKKEPETQDKDKTSEIYNFIKEIINKENEEKPFAGVPEDERRLLISIKDAVVHKNEDAAILNISELGTLTSVRNKTYLKTLRTNRWALPLAIIGVIVSIIFGIMNLVGKMNYDRIENMLKHTLQTQTTDVLKK